MGDHQELVLQQNITHWSHMEDIFILNGPAAADEVSWLQTTGEFSKD
jgi:hypothetical protein